MKPEFLLRTFFGLLLLIPGFYIGWTTLAAPALDTLDKSQTDYAPLREDVEDVGNENFEHLLDDNPTFDSALNMTYRLVGVRVLIVAFVPLIIGGLIGLQGTVLRNINRVLLTLIVVFLSPVVFAILIPFFLGRTWDFDTFDSSPLGEIPDWLLLVSPSGAKNVVTLTDAALTLGLAVVVGGSAYAAVIRGRQTGSPPILAFVGVWLVGLLLTLASAAQSFILPYVMTNGGPGRSTVTIPFSIFQDGFRFMQFGLASAEAMFLIVPAVIIGFLIWAVVSFFRLRIAFVPSPAKNYNPLALLSLPTLALLAVPTLGLIGWGFWLVNKNGGMEAGGELLDLDNTFSNTVSIPWMTIWLVQLPVTYLIGFALGYLRPFGRWGANLLFLPLMLFALIPAEALMIQWFETAREKELLNTESALVYPWMFGIISLLVFKLFFDGAHEKYEAARQDGQPVAQAFVFQVFLPSLGITLLIGAVLSFLATQSVMWPMVTLVGRDQYTAPQMLVFLRNAEALEFANVAGAVMTYSRTIALIFFPVFLLLHFGVVDRLAILAGAPQFHPEKEEVTPESLLFVEP